MLWPPDIGDADRMNPASPGSNASRRKKQENTIILESTDITTVPSSMDFEK